MSRRALLVFADDARLDLARRRLPVAALPLLRSWAFLETRSLAADVHIFGPRPALAAARMQSHQQHGRDFAERFENAIAELTALGYDEIVAIGRDCPDLSADDVAQAFEQLRNNRLVLGPDHRGGCYLIAVRTGDRALLRGIRWNRNTDCTQLCRRSPQSVALLPVKHDIDSWADVRLVARAHDHIARLATFLLQPLCVASVEVAHFVHAAPRFIRVHGQMPPPRAFA